MTAPSSQRAWRREGLLVGVSRNHPWWATHAQPPTVLPVSDRLWRVYFAARDRANRAHIVAVDIDPGQRMRVVAEHLDPTLAPGPPGTFDHSGMGPSYALKIDGRVLLYYTGVSRRQDVPHQHAIGLAVSDDGGLTFRKAAQGPVFATGPLDPYFSSVPTVLKTDTGFRMWYVSGTAWCRIGDAVEPRYEICTTTSADGLIWDSRSAVALPLRTPWSGLGRGWVTETEGRLRLWLCHRGDDFRNGGDRAYRMASVSLDADGVATGPIEPLVFANPPGPDDFDSWMQAYACVEPYQGELHMFYNGNDFGRQGFGWATCRGSF